MSSAYQNVCPEADAEIDLDRAEKSLRGSVVVKGRGWVTNRWTGRVPTHLPSLCIRLHSSAEVLFPGSLGTESIGCGWRK